MTFSSRPPFSGTRRKLVLAFDVGTTYSGISYSILDPGQVPEIKPVTRFPAQEQVGGASKIPTIIYYDQNGTVCAVGAEAVSDSIGETAEDEGWTKAEWFKLHLRPKTEASRQFAIQTFPLPLNKTVSEVFGDFLKYLFQCASDFIQDTHANGRDLWASVEKDIDYVLSHPNGWEGIQQSLVRQAVVLAGLIPDTTEGHARISFVTEGEASLHFSIQNGLPAGVMKRGDGVVIVDAGGGTIDVSAYSRNTNVKDSFEEIAAPQCHFHGSFFVSIAAHLFLHNFLADSDFFDDLGHIVRCFDKTTKLRFRSIHEPQYIRFGSTRDNDEACGIRFGQLKLEGADVAKFFEPSVNSVVNAVKEQRKAAHKGISHVVLVGGFAASDWLYHEVLETLRPLGLNVMRPESHLSKAVSDGAISFYLDHFVRARVSKVTYGNFCHIPYEPSDPEHLKRQGSTFTSVSGSKRISDSFDIILPTNTQVSEAKEFRKPYYRESENKSEFRDATFSIWCYRGTIAEPRWKDVDPDMYTKICTIEVDLSHISLTPRYKGRAQYFRLDYDLVLLFGLTELKAQVAWKEGSIEKRSPTKIVYDPDITRDD